LIDTPGFDDTYNVHALERLIEQPSIAKKRAERVAQEVRIFEIPALLAGHSTKALGDYGAKKNFIKEEVAIRLRLPINRDLVCKVTVGSGKPVTTTGAVTAPFRFKGEHDVHDLKFHLLPDCIHDVILGKPFLKLTETFSKLSNFYRRVKERVVKGISQFHLLYLGASSPMFEGSVNGQPQAALADSGSKVLVMDEAYARSTGVSIQTGHEHQTRLTYADNSTADTSGMAYGVEWRFGRDGEFTSPYQLNFHILKNAPANVILCDTFLYDNEAFSRYNYYLVDNDDDYEGEDDESHCFAIDIDRRKKRMQSKKFTVP
jgi:gag-polyprotein putative aspartyl protease